MRTDALLQVPNGTLARHGAISCGHSAVARERPMDSASQVHILIPFPDLHAHWRILMLVYPPLYCWKVPSERTPKALGFC